MNKCVPYVYLSSALFLFLTQHTYFNSHSLFAVLSTCVSPILITFTEKSFYLSFESVYLRSAVSTMFGRFDQVSLPTKCMCFFFYFYVSADVQG